jgi:hypothetical protein
MYPLYLAVHENSESTLAASDIPDVLVRMEGSGTETYDI